MPDYGPETYGERIAEVYDQWYRKTPGDAAFDLLAELAGTGPALELGIGSGRMAIPLVERGITVHGIDSSNAMVAKLREKPGGRDIPVTVGDFARFELDEAFELVFVAFNTFFALLTQEDQLECFRRVAGHLTDTGVFLMEAFVPDLGRFDRGQRSGVTEQGLEQVMLEASTHRRSEQRVDTTHVMITEKGVQLYPVRIRYAWPSELDLMARLAGLRLRHRYGGWDGCGFGDGSEMHVSIYEKG